MALLRKLPIINIIQYSRLQKAVQYKLGYFTFIKHNLRYFSDKKMCTKTAMIVLSPGSEEMELITSADVLRRGGVNVTIAGLCDEEPVKCSRDVVIKPDVSLESVKNNKYDVIIMPGGLGGAKAMADSQLFGDILKQQEKENRLIAAICAAPTALAAHKIGQGKNLTSYPSLKSQLDQIYCYKDSPETLTVTDDNLITSRGPGTAIHFAFTILETLCGLDKAKEVAKAMLYKYK